MITFDVWMDGVVGNASVIANRELLKEVWIKEKKNITSITSFDEAYEQLIGDLDALGYLEVYSSNPSLSEDQQTALREYIEAFKRFDVQPFIKEDVLNFEILLDSYTWEALEKKAQRLVLLFKGTVFKGASA